MEASSSMTPWILWAFSIVIPLSIGLMVTSLLLAYYPTIESRLSAKTGGYIEWMATTLDRLFRPTSSRNCLLVLIGSTASIGFLGFLLTFGQGLLNIMITLAALYLGWSLPRFILEYAWKRRLRRIDQQLVDALDLMANSIRSGLNLLKVIQLVAKEMPDPIGQEFQLVLNQHHLGRSLNDALEEMAERLPSDDVNMALTAILILRESGGDLSETFSVIAHTIRQRRKVEGKIRAMTAQGLTQASILFILPFAFALLIHLFNPDYLQPLYSTQWGYLLILAMLGLQTIGGIILKQIVTIDV